MPRLSLAVAVAALCLLALPAPPRPLAADGPEDVFVTNFPEVQRVAGTVTVGAPVPQTRLVRFEALASPGRRSDPSDYTEAGVLDAAGFGSVTLSLGGTVQGRLVQPAPVGVLLLPDVPDVVATFRTHGIAQFALAVEATATPAEPGVFHAEPAYFRLAFPRYRVLVYNTSPRTAEVAVYAYLGSG